MTTFTSEHGAAKRANLLPKWVIEHLIKLSEHAGSAGFSTFEEKLAEATEALLEELNEKGAVPVNVCRVASASHNNIIAFKATDHRFQGKSC